MATKYRRMVADAAKAGAHVVVLPEFSMTGYFAHQPKADWGEKEPLPESIPHGDSCRLFAELAKDNGVFVLGSLYERGGLGFRKQKGVRFATAVLFDPNGNAGAAYRRQHVGAGNESDYFERGNSDYPVFGLPNAAVAIATGYDQWFPELARIAALKGAEILLYPTATGENLREGGSDSPEAWKTVLRSHAITNGIFVATANRVGTEGSMTFFGGSQIIAPSGAILAQGTADQEEIVSADIDRDAVEQWRERFPFLLRREPETYGVILGRLSLKNPAPSESVGEP